MHALLDSGTRVLVNSARLAQLFHVALSRYLCNSYGPTERRFHIGLTPPHSLGSLCNVCALQCTHMCDATPCPDQDPEKLSMLQLTDTAG